MYYYYYISTTTTVLLCTIGDYCYVRDETVCYSKYGYDILSTLQTGFWDATGTWNPNFFSNVTWEVTQDGRYCYRRELTLDSRGRTNTAIYGSHCASEAKILNGDPPKAHKTVHICPDTTVQWGSYNVTNVATKITDPEYMIY